MRLRNWKETVEPTIEETLADVHPRTLDEPFGYYAIVGLPIPMISFFIEQDFTGRHQMLGQMANG